VTNTDPYDAINPHLSATNSFTVIVRKVDVAPTIHSIGLTSGVVSVTWISVSGTTYRLQYENSVTSTNWNDVVPDVPATGPTTTATNVVGSAPQRFYRVKVVP
jgi:hypothetical protein